MSCPPFYKPGTLANGRPGCVPTWDINQGGADDVFRTPPIAGAPGAAGPVDDAEAQRQAEADVAAAEARMNQAGAAYHAYQRQAVPVKSELQRFIMLGVALILLVIAFNRLTGS